MIKKILLPYTESRYSYAYITGYDRITLDGREVVGRVWSNYDGSNVWYAAHTKQSYFELGFAMNAEDEALEQLGYKLLNDIEDADKYRILL